MSFRKPDWAAPCSCSHHFVAWEHAGMLSDPAYRQHWITERFPWYERNASHVFLFISATLDPRELAGIDLQAERLLADDSFLLHHYLASGISAEYVRSLQDWVAGWTPAFRGRQEFPGEIEAAPSAVHFETP